MPTIGDGLLVIKGDSANQWLFLQPDKPDWVVTNDSGAAILAQCDGCKSLKQIAESLALEYTDVATFHRHVRDKSSLLEEIPGAIAGDWQLQTSASLERITLNSVHLNLTQNCNLACSYCYATARPSVPTTLPVSAWQSILHQINAFAGKVTVSFTGGEPLLVPFCLDLAKHSRELGNKNHLLTNGMAITKKNAARVANSFDLIRISIDGSDKATHEDHRGSNTFEKTLNAVELLKKENAALTVSMTVTQRNLTDIAEMCRKFGANLSFQPLFKAGSASKNSDLEISGEQYYFALAGVQGTKPLAALESILDNAKQRKNRKCAIGDAEISIAPNGDIFPCHMLHEPSLCAGNALKEDIATIYKTSSVLKSCRSLTVENIEGCRDCPIRYICGGSCRARAYFETGRLDKAGDFCSYEKLAFVEGIFNTSNFSQSAGQE